MRRWSLPDYGATPPSGGERRAVLDAPSLPVSGVSGRDGSASTAPPSTENGTADTGRRERRRPGATSAGDRTTAAGSDSVLALVGSGRLRRQHEAGDEHQDGYRCEHEAEEVLV